MSVTGTGVLGNDTDVDADPLTALLVSGPNHGTLSFQSDGSFTYTPQSGYRGIDTFTYLVNDGTTGSTPGTVRIFVNPVVQSLGKSSTTLLVRRNGSQLQVVAVVPSVGATSLLLLDISLASVHELTIQGANNVAETLKIDFSFGGRVCPEPRHQFQRWDWRHCGCYLAAGHFG